MTSLRLSPAGWTEITHDGVFLGSTEKVGSRWSLNAYCVPRGMTFRTRRDAVAYAVSTYERLEASR